MQSLWAPWRMEFIGGPREKAGCFLCHAGNAKCDPNDPANALILKDTQCGVIFRGKEVLCLLNRYPYSNGHLLIAPYGHQADLDDMPESALLEMMVVAREAKRVLQRVVHAHGFNMGLNLGPDAGAGVADHVHMHIVPRWRGDTNFMPVLTDTKIIPQALAELCDKLRAEWPSSGSCAVKGGA
jgi:ATP adenylyltransferase